MPCAPCETAVRGRRGEAEWERESVDESASIEAAGLILAQFRNRPIRVSESTQPSFGIVPKQILNLVSEPSHGSFGIAEPGF